MASIDDWSLLRTFLAVARAGSLNGAAQDIGVGVSTVHRHVQALEEALGTALVERRGRGSGLTAAGEALLNRAEPIEEAIVALGREVGGGETALEGTVHLTTTDTFAHAFLAPRMPEFAQRYPHIALEVSVENRHYRLGRGEADIALRPGSAPSEPDIVARPVAEVGLAVYGAHSYLERHGRPRDLCELRAHRALVPDASLSHVVYGRRSAELFDPGRVGLRSASLLVLAAAAAEGAGLALLPCFVGDANPNLCRLFAPEPEGTLWLLYSASLRHRARVRAVCEFLEEAVRSDAARLVGAELG